MAEDGGDRDVDDGDNEVHPKLETKGKGDVVEAGKP